MGLKNISLLARRFWTRAVTCSIGAGATALFLCAGPAGATPVETPQGYVTAYFAGWRSATLRVWLDISFQNPDGCSMTDGYITDPADAGNSLFTSTLLTAFATHKKVSLIIEGCYLNRLQIIGVYVWS